MSSPVEPGEEPVAEEPVAAPPAAAEGDRQLRSAVGPMLSYVGLRILLTVTIAAVIIGFGHLLRFPVPLIVASMMAVVIQLPLSHLILGGFRDRAIQAVIAARGERARIRADLRAAMDREDDRRA